LKGLADIMALASFRRDDPRPYPTSPLFATEPNFDNGRKISVLRVDAAHSIQALSCQKEKRLTRSLPLLRHQNCQPPIPCCKG
jgi:hypothetical protein